MKYFTLLSLFLLSSCGTLQSGSPTLDAIYSGTSALIASKDAISKCEQGHKQDRINCRNKKQKQVDDINSSIKKHTKQ